MEQWLKSVSDNLGQQFESIISGNRDIYEFLLNEIRLNSTVLLSLTI